MSYRDTFDSENIKPGKTSKDQDFQNTSRTNI